MISRSRTAPFVRVPSVMVTVDATRRMLRCARSTPIRITSAAMVANVTKVAIVSIANVASVSGVTTVKTTIIRASTRRVRTAVAVVSSVTPKVSRKTIVSGRGIAIANTRIMVSDVKIKPTYGTLAVEPTRA